MSSSTLRLAILGDSTHPNVERWNAGLRKAGADTYVLSLRHRTTVPQFPTHWLPTVRYLGRQLNYLLATPSAQSFLRQWRPDVLLAYYVTGYGTLGRLCRFHPLVQVTSGSDVLLAPQNRLMRGVVRRNLIAADLVTAWASHMAEAAYSLGAKNVFVLPAGIKLDIFHKHRIPEPKLDDLPRLIVTRSLKAFYRIDLIVEAMRVLASRQVPVTLTIVGDGPERKTLEKLIAQYRLQKRIHLAGFVLNDQLPALLAQNNMYISLVPSDGVSASLLEAMAMGLLPLVPDNPANVDWITHGENGLVIQNTSPEQIASLIQATDHGLRCRAWQQNPVIVSERADLSRNAELYMRQFRQLVRDH